MTVTERFLKYITFDTQSDEGSDTCPSTEKQLILGEYLRDELRALGAKEACIDENGYVYATVPASRGFEKAPVPVFIAHMDTSPSASGKDVRAVLTTEEGPDGRPVTVIRSDGTTLLGADDKAGIAEIVTAAERMLKNPEAHPHPELRLVFTPDEEIGRGTDRIDLDRVNAAYGFTVDGGEVGELSYECFNAASAQVRIRGVSYHPGDSYGKMKNAVLMAQEFISLLPPDEIPARTRGREGFYHLDEIRGDVSECVLRYIIRDHDREKLEERKRRLREAAKELDRRYGDPAEGEEHFQAAEVTVTDSYSNMIEAILPKYAFLLDTVREVYRELGITPDESPIRGGTDGARLSFLGLPCPNLGTGGHDFHGPKEYITKESMEKAVEVLLRLAEKLARRPKA